MSNIKTPTCGRMVHLFPNSESSRFGEGPLPAIVQDDSDTPTLTVFTGIAHNAMIVSKSVVHRSKKVEDHPFWDWPEIK